MEKAAEIRGVPSEVQSALAEFTDDALDETNEEGAGRRTQYGKHMQHDSGSPDASDFVYLSKNIYVYNKTKRSIAHSGGQFWEQSDDNLKPSKRLSKAVDELGYGRRRPHGKPRQPGCISNRR